MSTPTREKETDAPSRREVLARLTDALDQALADVDIADVEVGEVERHEAGRLLVPVAVEEARRDEKPQRGEEPAEQKSWSEEDPEGFEEAIEYLLDKNRELYRRLS